LPWPRVVIGAAFPTMFWLGSDSLPGDSFPEIRATAALSQTASEKLFQHAPKSWPNVLRDADASKPQSFPLPLEASIREVSHYEAISSPNVAAVLPGSDPNLRNEYVVYTAHTDHLGIGKPINGDSIYNGAADDASGTAALLVIAQAFKSLARAPARSILFLAVTAEEKGLLGSDYFAHFPTVPIRSIVADINMDGASLFYTFNDIIALGAADSTLDAVVRRNAARLGLKVSQDPDPDQHFFVRADQYSFVRQGVPSVFITEGEEARDPKFNAKKFNEQWIATRYHAPSDDMSQPMDLDASVEFMQVNFLVGYDVAQDPRRPTWKPGDFFGEKFSRK
jgi:Zn-dependent M28 family amino/carboxypeptidase